MHGHDRDAQLDDLRSAGLRRFCSSWAERCSQALFFSSLSYGAGDKTAHMNKKLRQTGLFQLYEEVVSAIEHDGYYSAPQQDSVEDKDKDKTEAEDAEPLSHGDRTRRAKADVVSPSRGSPSKRSQDGTGTQR